ncbi:MAG: S1 family peptidase [Bacteroides sp.]|nr:S1 family peptidase [Roseburia sp.]MCM1463109.1 S1 family peptidase [Bacteroides sp.]
MKIKNLFKKATAVLLAGIMATSAGTATFAESEIAPNNSIVIMNTEFDPQSLIPDEGMIRQDFALQAYDELYDHFEQDENNNYIYPDNYAGEYIDDDYNLVLLITDSEDSFYKDILINYDCVRFETVDYSYSELDELREKSVTDLLTISSDPLLYCASYVDIKSNTAVVEINSSHASSLNSESKKRFLTNRNPAVTYKFVDGNIEAQSTTVIGGDYLRQTASSYRCDMTAGMAGFYNGKPAIVSCGHAMENSAKISLHESSGIVDIGKVSYVQFTDNKYGDYSFIVLDDKIQTTNEVRTNTSTKAITDGYNKPLPIGTEIYSYGANSGLSKHKVTHLTVETNVQVTVGGIEVVRTIKGLTETKITQGMTQPGDSGGPYYLYSDSQWKFCGVHSGYSTDDHSRAVFTPYMYFSGGFKCKTS